MTTTTTATATQAVMRTATRLTGTRVPAFQQPTLGALQYLPNGDRVRAGYFTRAEGSGEETTYTLVGMLVLPVRGADGEYRVGVRGAAADGDVALAGRIVKRAVGRWEIIAKGQEDGYQVQGTLAVAAARLAGEILG